MYIRADNSIIDTNSRAIILVRLVPLEVVRMTLTVSSSQGRHSLSSQNRRLWACRATFITADTLFRIESNFIQNEEAIYQTISLGTPVL